jgi:polar amino acid transport system substrate-binding protein
LPPLRRCAAILLLSLAPLASPAETQVVTLSVPDHEALSETGLSIVTEMYRRIGYQVQESRLPARRSLREADSGESDGEVMRAADLEKRFPDLIRIPEPLIEQDIVAFTAGNPALLSGGWSDLVGHSICARLGNLLVEDDLNALSGVRVSYAEDSAQVFRMLKAGRCDYAVLPRSAWIDAEQAGITGLAEATPALAHFHTYHFVNRRRAMLVPSLAAVVRQLRAEGYIARAEAELDAAITAAQAASEPSR